MHYYICIKFIIVLHNILIVIILIIEYIFLKKLAIIKFPDDFPCLECQWKDLASDTAIKFMIFFSSSPIIQGS